MLTGWTAGPVVPFWVRLRIGRCGVVGSSNMSTSFDALGSVTVFFTCESLLDEHPASTNILAMRKESRSFDPAFLLVNEREKFIVRYRYTS